MGQDEYVFESGSKKASGGGIGKFIWNSQTKEFCGRDGASWGKVSLFYAIFYLGLGSFFIGMLAVFIQIMPKDKPTYYGETSVMNSRGYPVNPGLGFRPQVDVEDLLISYNPDVRDGKKSGHGKYVDNLRIFLENKYPKVDDALNCKSNTSYADELEKGNFCDFDYKTIFANSPCTEENAYGYTTQQPCVLIKLNKIVSWTPKTSSGFIGIDCHGETAVDKDNVLSVKYYSEGTSDNKQGQLDAKYYPFFSQKGYKAPFVWAKFTVNTDTLVNIECTAKAENIEYERMTKRGLTKFALFVNTNKD